MSTETPGKSQFVTVRVCLCLSAVSFLIISAIASDNPVDVFGRRALAEWIVRGDSLPASPATLGSMITDLPASVGLARAVTGLPYELKHIDTGVFELTTPRGLIARVRPIRVIASRDTGLFEAVGDGAFHRQSGVFRGLFAMRFKYGRNAAGAVTGDFEIYLDVQNRLLRFFALFARGLINARMKEELVRMLSEARSVMASAEGGNRPQLPVK